MCALVIYHKDIYVTDWCTSDVFMNFVIVWGTELYIEYSV